MPKCDDCAGVKTCREREQRVFKGDDYSKPAFLDDDVLERIAQEGKIGVMRIP